MNFGIETNYSNHRSNLTNQEEYQCEKVIAAVSDKLQFRKNKEHSLNLLFEIQFSVQLINIYIHKFKKVRVEGSTLIIFFESNFALVLNWDFTHKFANFLDKLKLDTVNCRWKESNFNLDLSRVDLDQLDSYFNQMGITSVSKINLLSFIKRPEEFELLDRGLIKLDQVAVNRNLQQIVVGGFNSTTLLAFKLEECPEFEKNQLQLNVSNTFNLNAQLICLDTSFEGTYTLLLLKDQPNLLMLNNMTNETRRISVNIRDEDDLEVGPPCVIKFSVAEDNMFLVGYSSGQLALFDIANNGLTDQPQPLRQFQATSGCPIKQLLYLNFSTDNLAVLDQDDFLSLLNARRVLKRLKLDSGTTCLLTGDLKFNVIVGTNQGELISLDLLSEIPIRWKSLPNFHGEPIRKLITTSVLQNYIKSSTIQTSVTTGSSATSLHRRSLTTTTANANLKDRLNMGTKRRPLSSGLAMNNSATLQGRLNELSALPATNSTKDQDTILGHKLSHSLASSPNLLRQNRANRYSLNASTFKDLNISDLASAAPDKNVNLSKLELSSRSNSSANPNSELLSPIAIHKSRSNHLYSNPSERTGNSELLSPAKKLLKNSTDQTNWYTTFKDLSKDPNQIIASTINERSRLNSSSTRPRPMSLDLDGSENLRLKARTATLPSLGNLNREATLELIDQDIQFAVSSPQQVRRRPYHDLDWSPDEALPTPTDLNPISTELSPPAPVESVPTRNVNAPTESSITLPHPTSDLHGNVPLELIQTTIQNCLHQVQVDLRKDLKNLHTDFLRQIYDLKEELHERIDREAQVPELLERIRELEQENYQLRMDY